MATKFSQVYERAIFKFKDYSFLTTKLDYKEAILQQYLMSAITEFQHSCTVDLNDFDLDKEQFNVDLDNEMIEILALGIAYYWLSGQALNKELLRNIMHNKDYTSYSPGNLLREIQSLRDAYEMEFYGKVRTYSVRYSNIERRKV